MPLLKIMVNQCFNRFAERPRPGRNRRKPLSPGNIFPVGKQSLTIRDLASRGQRRTRGARSRVGAGTMAKAKKQDDEKEAPEAEGAEGEAAPKKGFLSKKLIIMAAAVSD